MATAQDKDEEAMGWVWNALIAHFVHPTKVYVLEALLWIGQPLSATDLENIFDGAQKHGLVSYHIKCLAIQRILECVGSRQVRGATEAFYWLAGVER